MGSRRSVKDFCEFLIWTTKSPKLLIFFFRDNDDAAVTTCSQCFADRLYLQFHQSENQLCFEIVYPYTDRIRFVRDRRLEKWIFPYIYSNSLVLVISFAVIAEYAITYWRFSSFKPTKNTYFMTRVVCLAFPYISFLHAQMEFQNIGMLNGICKSLPDHFLQVQCKNARGLCCRKSQTVYWSMIERIGDRKNKILKFQKKIVEIDLALKYCRIFFKTTSIAWKYVWCICA